MLLTSDLSNCLALIAMINMTLARIFAAFEKKLRHVYYLNELSNLGWAEAKPVTHQTTTAQYVDIAHLSL